MAEFSSLIKLQYMKTFQEPAATFCLQLSFAETLLEGFQTMNLRVYP